MDLLHVSEAELLSRIQGAEIDWSHVAPERQIAIRLGIDPDNPPAPETVRWFHATRATRDAKFDDGLLPTPQALPALWKCLSECARQWVSPADWIDYQHSFSRGDRYYSGQFLQKQSVPGWEGPFAFLVRDAALGTHGTHKSFVRVAEVVEDICADFDEVYGFPLLQAYQGATRPCLVIFTTSGGAYGTVQAAANYVYRSLRGVDCGRDCNANFTGRGRAVPPSSIVLVEWLESMGAA